MELVERFNRLVAELSREGGHAHLTFVNAAQSKILFILMPGSLDELQRLLKERGGLGYEFVGVRVRRANGRVEWLSPEFEPIPSEPWAVACMFMLNAARVLRRRVSV